MNPVLKYSGAKWRLAPWIISHMPPHDSYLEPFFGSGAVFFNKPPARIETINDIDGSVIHFFRTCREYLDELAYAVSLTPWAREEFLNCEFLDDEDPADDIERAKAVRIIQSYGEGYRKALFMLRIGCWTHRSKTGRQLRLFERITIPAF